MRRMLSVLSFGLGFGLALAEGRAGEIAGYVPGNPVSQATYDRFTGGYPSTTGSPTTPVSNPSPLFLGNGYSNNLSGVGWFNHDPTYSVGLVSERHFIGAVHVGVSVGAQINFTNAAGQVVTATVQTLRSPTTTFTDANGVSQTKPSDVLLGTLSEPIPASALIANYRILQAPVTLAPLVFSGPDQVSPAAPASFYSNQPLLNYGQNPAHGVSTHLGRNVLESIHVFGDYATNATVAIAYDYTPSSPGDFFGIGGDSGAPSFIPYNGEMTIIGAHYGTSGPFQPGAFTADSFLPYYINQLNAMMAMDTDATHPSGYSLAVIPVPEPALLGLAAIALMVRFRRAEHKE